MAVYDFFINAIEIDEIAQLNPNTTFCARSSKPETAAGHAPLRCKDIAGVTVGAVAVVLLLAGIWVLRREDRETEEAIGC